MAGSLSTWEPNSNPLAAIILVWCRLGWKQLRQFLATYQPQHYRGRAGHQQQWQAFARGGLAALLKLAAGWQQGADHYIDSAPKPNPELRLTNRF